MKTENRGSLTYSEKVKLEVQRIINEYQPGDCPRATGYYCTDFSEAEKDLVGSGA